MKHKTLRNIKLERGGDSRKHSVYRNEQNYNFYLFLPIAMFDLFKAHGTVKTLTRQSPVLDQSWLIWYRHPAASPMGSMNWRRSYLQAISCKQHSGAVCRRKAASGHASEANGESMARSGVSVSEL